MRSIYFKELKSFLSSIAGYAVILAFLVFAGLMLWVLPDTSIPEYGYASMDQFFRIAPWLLLFLIPAITMRSFADEFKSGTIEWLFTKPLNSSQVIMGKFLAAITLVIIAIIPTLVYVFSIYYLAMDDSAMDFGGLAGAYIGLLLLVAAFTSVGIFCSSLTDNQIVSYLASLFLCFLLYSGFEGLSRLDVFRGGADYYLGWIGLDYHYNSINRGLIDTRDVIYFSTLVILFLALTRFIVQNKKAKA